LSQGPDCYHERSRISQEAPSQEVGCFHEGSYCIVGGFESAKRKVSELSCHIMPVAKSKDLLKEDIKVLNKAIKTLKSKVDNQLVQKNTHAVKRQ
jgi:hypothetical protein